MAVLWVGPCAQEQGFLDRVPVGFAVIAPFVLQEAGNEAIIECRGEDGNHWRYLFKDGGMVEQSAKASWE